LQSMRQIAIEVAELARDCGGVMSGEHGDGRARGPLLEAFYGPKLLEAFADVKRVFDPAGILNPGMIVGTQSLGGITDHLRIAEETQGLADCETYFDYSEQEGFRSAV